MLRGAAALSLVVEFRHERVSHLSVVAIAVTYKDGFSEVNSQESDSACEG